MVDLLLRRGAEANLQNSDGRYRADVRPPSSTTPLSCGACCGRAQILRRARSASGETALQLAKEHGNTECVKVLAEAAEAVAEGRAGAGGASSGAAAAAEDAPLLGQCVVLGGLSARPELNGQRGVAQSFEGGRYAVALEGGGESVRVRPGNLSPAVADAGVRRCRGSLR